MKKDRGLIWSIAALVLTACGGGGSSSSAPGVREVVALSELMIG